MSARMTNTTSMTSMIAWLLAGILLYSGIDHSLTFNRFLLSIAKYQCVPQGVDVGILGIAIIVAMVFSGLTLVDRPSRRYGAVLAAILFSIFFIATLQAWLRGIDIECGCAISGRNIDWIAVLKPLLLAVASAVVIVSHIPPSRSVRGRIRPPWALSAEA